MKTAMMLAALGAAVLTLGACAGLPPSAAEMAKLPVVRYGDPAPAGTEFVLHYPARTPLPVVTTVGGSLLEKPGTATMEVAVNRDVYVYRQWVSFDGKSWVQGDKAVGLDIALHLPGEKDGRAPGSLSAVFDVKP